MDHFDALFDFWFDAGWDVCKGNRSDECFPPLNDMIAQGAWLYGFRAAWIALNGEKCIHEQACRSRAENDSDIEEMISMQLSDALDGRARLLLQLRASDRDAGGCGIN
ncbi:hypothetical protein Thivi_1673 [Thiocystis violascens DSM 198]|uniref:Uncharacterized protein n=2 Tax=Thiocystis violascens TaxID=73141 RepID=I3Y9H9_THIV6|nr:hypothetical protein Thivi_1673 [Thiocystis violascens DSM 198]